MSACGNVSQIFRLSVILLVAGSLGALAARAVTMQELLGDPKMSPKRFASYFEDFAFERHPFDVINPHQFLSNRAGDCIDYAVLADHVLSQRGYHTRLVRVEMIGKNVGHAVCYIDDDRVYLDYNNRRYFFTLTRSGARLREIAAKVADSLKANWIFAQEFTFDYKTFIKRSVFTVVKTDPPESDPDLLARGE